MRRIFLVFCGVLLGFLLSVRALASEDSYVVEGALPLSVSAEKQETLPYSLLVFEPRSSREKFPLFLLLHPVGNTEKEYLKLWKEEALRRRVMLLAPALKPSYANDPGRIKVFRRLLIHILKKYPVDRGKIFLIGTSAGGLVAQWLMVRYPSVWRGVVLIAVPPAESLIQAPHPADLPPFFWIHGEKDPQIPFGEAAGRFQKMKQRGFKGEFWSDPQAGHEHKVEWHARIWEWAGRRGAFL